MQGLDDIRIAGMQKLTLLDYPGRMAAILFLQGCNMRCPFCHNSTLVPMAMRPTNFRQSIADAARSVPLSERLSRDRKSFRERDKTPPSGCMDMDEALSYLSKRRNLLDGVVVSGGEPSIQEIRPLLRELKSMGYPVKIDTNGLRPGVLRQWIGEGLVDYVAMDVKNCAERYPDTCGLPSIDMDAIRESARIIMSSAPDYEFRTTVMAGRHSPEDIESIGRDIIPGAKRYFLQRFVMRDTVPDKSIAEPDDVLMSACLKFVEPYVVEAKIR